MHSFRAFHLHFIAGFTAKEVSFDVVPTLLLLLSRLPLPRLLLSRLLLLRLLLLRSLLSRLPLSR